MTSDNKSSQRNSTDKKSSKPLFQGTLSSWLKPGKSGSSSSENAGRGGSSSNDRREPSSPSSSRSSAPSSAPSASTRSQSEKKPSGFRQSTSEWYHTRRSSSSSRLSRDELREIADTTLAVLDEGVYQPPGHDEPYDLLERMYCTNGDTTYHSPDDEEIAAWAEADLPTRQTRIIVKECSTLVGARKLYEYVYARHDMETAAVGVLNFASAKKPGGGFLSGAQAQEESIARVSTLYYSLLSEPAKPFYEHNQQDPDNHMYNHAMIYSPGVVLMRDDRGKWLDPVEVDILTSAAVNAGEVRRQVEWQVKMRDVRARYRVFQENEAKARKEAEHARRLREGRSFVERLTSAGAAARVRAKEEARRAEARAKDEDVEMADATDPALIPLPPSPPSPSIPLEKQEDPVDGIAANPEMGSPKSKRPLSIEIRTDTESQEEEKPVPLKELLVQAEKGIEAEMRERIARLLYLFYLRGAQHIVLGSFGTGVFQNKVETIAQIFYDLLAAPGGKFHGVFENVVFAILGADTVNIFQGVFANVVVQESEEEEVVVKSNEKSREDVMDIEAEGKESDSTPTPAEGETEGTSESQVDVPETERNPSVTTQLKL